MAVAKTPSTTEVVCATRVAAQRRNGIRTGSLYRHPQEACPISPAYPDAKPKIAVDHLALALIEAFAGFQQLLFREQRALLQRAVGRIVISGRTVVSLPLSGVSGRDGGESLTALKIAVLAPMPMASVMSVRPENPGRAQQTGCPIRRMIHRRTRFLRRKPAVRSQKTSPRHSGFGSWILL